MNDRILDWAMKIQSIAQTGLAYCRDEFDRERYTELRELSAEMLAERTELPVGRVRELFCGESGYQTPKLDTRAAIVEDGRILLVRERDGRWALPGGWCDVDRSVAENTVKEALEETGLTVEAERLTPFRTGGGTMPATTYTVSLRYSCSAVRSAANSHRISKRPRRRIFRRRSCRSSLPLKRPPVSRR